jgi:hypothetical protein
VSEKPAGRELSTVSNSAQVAVFGTGRIGVEAIRALLPADHRIVAGIVHDPAMDHTRRGKYGP